MSDVFPRLVWSELGKPLPLSPSKCAICQATEGEFVDTGARFPGHPADNFNVYLCAGCARSVAQTLNPTRALEEAQERIAELEAELEQADRELGAVKVLTNSGRVK